MQAVSQMLCKRNFERIDGIDWNLNEEEDQRHKSAKAENKPSK